MAKLFNTDKEAGVVSSGQTQSNGWVKIGVILDADGASAIKTNGSITLLFKTTGSGYPTATYYIDDIEVREQIFDGTFETMTTGDLSSEVVAGAATASIAQNPTNANEKVLKLDKTNTTANGAQINIKLTDDFVAQAQVGKKLTFKAYGVKEVTTTLLAIRAGIPGFTGTWLANQQKITEATDTTSSEWVTFEFVLTQEQVDALNENKCIRFLLKTENDKSAKASFYVDDIAIA